MVQSPGPPAPGPSGETHDDFDTRILQVRNVFNITAKVGRKKSVCVLDSVGKGATGFATRKATEPVDASRKAKNRAVHSLRYTEPCDMKTV